MDSFFLATDKYHRGASLHQLIRHCTRAHTPGNADPSRSHLNVIEGDWRPGAFLTNRANGVAAIEVLLAASPGWWGYREGSSGWTDLKSETIRFFEMRFRGAPTATADHQDERTGHLHATYSPLALGRSAKALIGGPKYVMSALQTEFQKQVGANFGLTRIERSVPSFTDLHDFYAYFDGRSGGQPWEVVDKKRLLQLQYLASMTTDAQRREAAKMAACHMNEAKMHQWTKDDAEENTFELFQQ